ncbi:helix-turn-helix transcriptional regulator [Nocardia sp. NPDC058176]|uniref:helix-turn-helix transcriptional regulator n=1 Tax=Nocardia sp. NPDC058176 TaxID=3346368 RepID=UPI0036DA9799
MNPYALPAILTSQNLEALLNIGRARLSRLRSDDPTFPNPVAVLSTPRKPRWLSRDIIRWMVIDGRLGEDALEPFAVIDDEGPIAQRWQLADAEFVTITGLRRPVELRTLRYTAINPEDPRKVALCVPVGDHPDLPAISHWIPTEALTQLGYAEARGAVAWIVPTAPGGWHPGTVYGATVDSAERELDMRLLRPNTLSQLLGHPLPFWQRGAVSKAAASIWVPVPHTEGPTPPVPAGPVPALAESKEFREQCAEVIAQISTGARDAPEGTVAQLAQLGNTMWDMRVGEFDWAGHRRKDLDPGWTLPIIPPRESNDEPEPLLPVQPPSVDLFEGLEWLLDQEGLPDQMAQIGVGFYGYPQSVEVIDIDLTTLPARLRQLLENAFTPIEHRTSWLHTALHRHIAGTEPHQPPIPAGWKADPEPHTHPALIVGDRRVYHVPRQTLSLGTPSTVHLVGTGPTDMRRYAAFLVDRTGAVVPIAINARSTTESIAYVLAAVALGFDEPLHMSRYPKLSAAPDLLIRMTEAMESTDHLEIDWTTLLYAVGPRANGLDDRELAKLLNDRSTSPWRDNDS